MSGVTIAFRVLGDAAQKLTEALSAISTPGWVSPRTKWERDKAAVTELRQRLERHVARWCK